MRFVIALVALLAAAPAVAGTTCPENSIFAGCWPDATSQFGYVASAQWGDNGFAAWHTGQPCTVGCYDLPAGVLIAVGKTNPYGGCDGGVHVTDVYQVTGPPGPALTFNANLVVQAALPPNSHYTAQLDGPGGASASLSDQVNGSAVIAVTAAPGAAFTLSASLHSWGEYGVFGFADAPVTGTILFGGLPAAYGVVSCQNYDVPTPAQPATWGGVKALYR